MHSLLGSNQSPASDARERRRPKPVQPSSAFATTPPAQSSKPFSFGGMFGGFQNNPATPSINLTFPGFNGAAPANVFRAPTPSPSAGSGNNQSLVARPTSSSFKINNGNMLK